MKDVVAASLLLSVIFTLVLAQAGKPKADQEREAVCRRVPCRPAKTLKLKVSETEVAEFDFPKGPYAADGYINKNPFAKDILYDCLIQHYKAQRLQKTTIIPVKSGLISFEHWPYPITQVVISNVRYAASK